MASPFPKYMFSRTDQLLLTLLVLIYCSIVTFLIVSGNGGMFTYTFDDAYIHLSVAENILHGNYGINAGEFSAPASSILWPFLMAPLSWTAFFEFVPLAVNILCAVFSVLFVYRMTIVALSNVKGTESDKVNRTAAVVLAIVVGLATNMVGIAFTGMEHSLQVLLECLIFYGLVRVLFEGDSRRLLYVSVVLLPLVRFEGMALSMAVLCVLFAIDSRKHALIGFAVIAVAMYGFGIFLFANSGWFFPASVLVKGGFVNEGPLWNHPLALVLEVLRGSRTVPLMFAVVALLPLFVHAACIARDRAQTALSFVTLAVIVAHFVWFGNGGDRYLVPVYAVAALGATAVFRAGLQSVFRKNIALGAGLVFTLAAMTFTANYFYQKKLPLAAANIYEQHYHMHRFVTEFYRKPVAVNDIGFVSYRNPHYVLDLAGLANYGVMALPKPQSASILDSLTHAHGAYLVMIYDGWFPNVPKHWTRIGAFVLRSRKTTAADSRVAVYVADTSAVRYARTELAAFRRSIPDRSLVELNAE